MGSMDGGFHNNSNNPNRASQQETRDRKKRWALMGTLAVAVVVVFVVAVVVVMSSTSQKGNDNPPPPSPLTPNDQEFEGTARLVLALSNVTQPMSATQQTWFTVTLAEFLQDFLVAADRPFQNGWAVALDDQQVLLLESDDVRSKFIMIL